MPNSITPSSRHVNSVVKVVRPVGVPANAQIVLSPWFPSMEDVHQDVQLELNWLMESASVEWEVYIWACV